MRVTRSASAFAPAAPVAKAIALTTFADGRVELHSDVAGAKVEVAQDSITGAVTVSERLPSGEVGESVTIEVSAPPPVDEVEKPAPAKG